MAGGSHPKSSAHKPSSSTPAPHSKSRWESAAANNPPPPPQSNQKLHKPNPSPKPNTGPSPKPVTPTAGPIQPPQLPPFPFPDLGPPPPPTYGFHMLERRPIVLADGTVRSYLALPSDYQDFPRPPLPPRFLHRGGHPDFPPTGPRIPPLNPDAFGFQNQNQNQNKRKFEEESVKHGSSGSYNNNHSNEKNYTLRADNRGAGTSCVADEMRTGKKMRIGRGDDVGLANRNNNRNVGEVNQSELKKAFFNFVKVINENEADRKKYLEDGKRGGLRCVACVRSSKDFPDMHALIMHTYSSDNADVRVDHLGLHKALCILMRWNYSKPPDNSKAYQFLPADEAGANQDDLIMWPPMVIIHNTITGKSKDGRMEGLGNREMDSKMRDLGFAGGKSKSLYGRDGHLGITLVKFGGDQSGLKEAIRMAEHFEKDNHGRKAWGCLQPVTLGNDDEKNPSLVKVDRSGEKTRILYGYLATAADLNKVDFETRRTVVIESLREHEASK
ncbi:RNA RECOGNITION MOTIF XS DOMAIN PROTEIN [Salix purpurea]|uniref:RNA RECOGNITION MOTIF XS DOMAIN PROTEIN n=1 Tax=Salix purpurea TaxID=77065 RepID=A0A9Q0Z929_SALPP|nr:RNA RECOGNITION MOTIF XS DOMAIN PROTEIN [Salix purpurea]